MQKTFFLKLKEQDLQIVFDFKAIEFIESYFNKSFLLIVGDSEAGQELTKLKNLKYFCLQLCKLIIAHNLSS